MQQRQILKDCLNKLWKVWYEQYAFDAGTELRTLAAAPR